MTRVPRGIKAGAVFLTDAVKAGTVQASVRPVRFGSTGHNPLIFVGRFDIAHAS